MPLLERAASPLLLSAERLTQPVLAPPSLPGCAEDVRWVTGAEARPGPHSLERFALLQEGCLYLLLPEMAHQERLGFGRPQLCLGVHLLYLPHPLRISSKAMLSTLMNALADSEPGAVSACPELWLFSPLLKLNRTYIHVSFSCTVSSRLRLSKTTTVGRKTLASKLGRPGFLSFSLTLLANPLPPAAVIIS